jgi:hypothetical protein
LNLEAYNADVRAERDRALARLEEFERRLEEARAATSSGDEPQMEEARERDAEPESGTAIASVTPEPSENADTGTKRNTALVAAGATAAMSEVRKERVKLLAGWLDSASTAALTGCCRQ